MSDAQYVAYSESAEGGYARQIAESGWMSWAAAVQKASEDYGSLLPKGLRTPDQHLFAAYDDDTQVGMLWLRIQARPGGLQAFVFDVQVDPDKRRRGYGRAIMLAGEAECRKRGVVSIGLNVFGQNAGARALYEQIGYEITSVQMRKRM
jgi:ribosomal protein S18 acetylase RimI-like enzyme